jgi:phage gpG-like protein
VVGTTKLYAATQELGGMDGRGRKMAIPARPFLKLEALYMEKIVRRMGDYLTQGL